MEIQPVNEYIFSLRAKNRYDRIKIGTEWWELEPFTEVRGGERDYQLKKSFRRVPMYEMMDIFKIEECGMVLYRRNECRLKRKIFRFIQRTGSRLDSAYWFVRIMPVKEVPTIRSVGHVIFILTLLLGQGLSSLVLIWIIIQAIARMII